MRSVSAASPSEVKTALSSLTLHVGSSTFAFSDAVISSTLQWSPGPTWNEGDSVELKLTVADTAREPEPPAAPATPRVTAGPSRLGVTWSPPDEGDEGTAPVTGYNLGHRPAGASAWTVLELVGDDYTVRSNGSIYYRIDGLDNGTLYEVRVRAASGVGPGPWSPTASGMPVVPWVAPYWRGTGGFVVRPADGRSAVVQLDCGFRRYRTLEHAGADGLIVRAVQRSGCLTRDGRPLEGDLLFEGIEDGGWYWINGDRNAAVAPLVVKASLNGELRPLVPDGIIASPGGDHRFVREVTGRLYGTLMVHEGSGYLGIVPHLTDTEGDGSHAAPYWKGGGGVVGRPLDGESAEVRLACGDGEPTTYTLEPGENGIVAALLPGGCFDGDGNPVAGDLEVDGLEDGAWYWINNRVPVVAPLVHRTSETATLTAPLVPEGVDSDAGPRGTLFIRGDLMGIVPRVQTAPP